MRLWKGRCKCLWPGVPASGGGREGGHLDGPEASFLSPSASCAGQGLGEGLSLLQPGLRQARGPLAPAKGWDVPRLSPPIFPGNVSGYQGPLSVGAGLKFSFCGSA